MHSGTCTKGACSVGIHTTNHLKDPLSTRGNPPLRRLVDQEMLAMNSFEEPIQGTLLEVLAYNTRLGYSPTTFTLATCLYLPRLLPYDTHPKILAYITHSGHAP